MPWPSNVAPDELIEASWGNDVVDSLTSVSTTVTNNYTALAGLIASGDAAANQSRINADNVLEASIADKTRVRSGIGGTAVTNQVLRVMAASQVVTLDGNGRAAVAFSEAFSGLWFEVVAWCGDTATANGDCVMGQFQRPNAGGFFIDVSKMNNTPATGSVRVDWIAIGLD